jgi:hypothetical protein
MIIRKIEGATWEVESLLRFRLLGYPYWVEWSKKGGGWHYYWIGQQGKTTLFYRSRSDAMQTAIEVLSEVLAACRGGR